MRRFFLLMISVFWCAFFSAAHDKTPEKSLSGLTQSVAGMHRCSSGTNTHDTVHKNDIVEKEKIVVADSLQQILNSTLQFIASQQYQVNSAAGFKGEWPTVMKLTIRFPFLGGAKEYADANCFTVTNIHNELAEIYLSDTMAYSFLKPVVLSAYDALKNYRSGNGYNFWRLYPVRFSFSRFDTTLIMRQPMTYRLKSKFIKKAANVVNDADDSSIGYYASLLHSNFDTSSLDYSLLASLYPYIDENRRYLHWYNAKNKDTRNTGAFMTWLGDEVATKYSSKFNTLLQNLTFYSPVSKGYPHLHKSYIPYGTNDVDAVVNANVLFSLAKAKETDSLRIISNAASFVTEKFRKGNFKRATIYYPNRYHLHAVTARAYMAGIEQLNEAVDLLIADIKRQQQKDGSFKSSRKLNRKDKIQSTVNALYALLQVGDVQKYQTKEVITKAFYYLMANMQADRNGFYYWSGGVFFSGGTVVKNYLHFKSDAYTTVMMCKCLQQMIEMKRKGIL
ncbi:MAG: hypothetical protein QM725_10690 [Lacibacter sp.]